MAHSNLTPGSQAVIEMGEKGGGDRPFKRRRCTHHPSRQPLKARVRKRKERGAERNEEKILFFFVIAGI